MPAANERFGASGAVTRPKCSADFEVLCLVSSAVEAPPSPSRRSLWAMSGQRLGEGQDKQLKIK